MVINSVPISVVPISVSGIWIMVTMSFVTVPNGVAAKTVRINRNRTTITVAGIAPQTAGTQSSAPWGGHLNFHILFSSTAYSLVASNAVSMAVNSPPDSKLDAA